MRPLSSHQPCAANNTLRRPVDFRQYELELYLYNRNENLAAGLTHP